MMLPFRELCKINMKLKAIFDIIYNYFLHLLTIILTTWQWIVSLLKFYVSHRRKNILIFNGSNDAVNYDLHGMTVVDPQLWLENDDAICAREALKAELNAQSDIYFDCFWNRQRLEKSFATFDNMIITNLTHISNREGCTGYYSFVRTKQTSKWSIYLTDNTLHLPGKLFIDQRRHPNENIEALYFSRNAHFCAYKLRPNEWTNDVKRIVKFCHVDNDATTLDDTLIDVRGDEYGGITWTEDSAGIYYIKEHFCDARNRPAFTLFYHKLHTTQADDIVFKFADGDKERMMGWQIRIFGCGLILPGHMGYSIHVKNAGNIHQELVNCQQIESVERYTILFNPYILCSKKVARASKFQLIGYDEDRQSLLVFTDYYCLKYEECRQHWKFRKIIRCKFDEARKGPKYWNTIVPCRKNASILNARELIGKQLLFASVLENQNEVNLYLYNSFNGELFGRINRNDETIQHFSLGSEQCIFQIGSYLKPWTIYQFFHPKFNREKGKISNTRMFDNFVKEIHPASKCDFDNRLSEQFVLKRIWLRSKRCRCPPSQRVKFLLEVIHAKNIVFDSSHPLLLYVYGGFGSTSRANFDTTYVHFLTLYQGVIAIVHSRGDGFLHKYAKGSKRRQNTYDDIITSTEYLIKQKYTKPKRIALYGRSNGGLSAAVCATQRPDLYGCIIAYSGVFDLLRFHIFGCGHYWKKEYGDPMNESDSAHLLKLSPIHNVHRLFAVKNPPSILLLSGSNDQRVDLIHSLKYISRLHCMAKKKNVDTNILLAKIYADQNHHYMFTDLNVDMLLFLEHTLSLKMS